MFYEIFKTLAENGLSADAWCLGVIISLYILHLLGIVLSWGADRCYLYIHDGTEKLGNWYLKQFERLRKGLVPQPLTREELSASCDYVLDGEKTTLPDGLYFRPGFDTLLVVVEDGRLADIHRHHDATAMHVYYVFAPAGVGCAFLFLDFQPVIAGTIAALYVALRTARAVVRTTKRVTKLEDK